MLKLETHRRLFWHNAFASEPVLVGTVALGDAFGWTTSRLAPALRSVLEEQLPGALPDTGLLNSAALVAHVAQQVQLLADVGTATSGVASRDERERRATVFFSCQDGSLGPHAFSLALQIVDRLIEPDTTPQKLSELLQSCIKAVERPGLERNTIDIVRAAVRRGIPWIRQSPMVRHVQFGQGHRQQRLWLTTFSTELLLARDYSRNKALTMHMLSHIRLPVGKFAVINDADAARKLAQEIGYPIVLKPVHGSQGRSVFVDLRNEAELMDVLKTIRLQERPFILQSFFPGDDHRLLVLSGKLVAAARRIPASLTGDGRHTISELTEIENRDPRRALRRTMEPIHLDGESERILARQGCTRDTVLSAGRVVHVKATANISTGGSAIDVMDIIHRDNVRAAERAAKAIGMRTAGVDFISPDISKSWSDVGGGICEVNSAVGVRPHLLATPQLDVHGLLLRDVYPDGDDGRIPTVILTGTEATTTSSILAKILSRAGHVVGCATSEGVTIDDELIDLGNLANADGASIVMRDATVTSAVLETDRGAFAASGMYLDLCDVVTVLDTRANAKLAGMSRDEIVSLSRKMLAASRKAVVLNADDTDCLALRADIASSVRTILFARDRETVRTHVADGADAVVLATFEGRQVIVVASRTGETSPIFADELSATGDGVHVLAAIATALGLGLDPQTIGMGLQNARVAIGEQT